MEQIFKIFGLFFKFGQFFGYFPFDTKKSCKIFKTSYSFTRSILMISFWFTSFLLFVLNGHKQREFGSYLSLISSNFSFFLVSITIFTIFLLNLIHSEELCRIYNGLWNFDRKVNLYCGYFNELSKFYYSNLIHLLFIPHGSINFDYFPF